MTDTIEERKATLDGSQRAWMKQMADALQLRAADGHVQPGVSQGGNELSSRTVDHQFASPAGISSVGFVNADPKVVSPQQSPLSQRKTPPTPNTPLQKAPQTQPTPAPAKAKERFVVPIPRDEKLAISNARTLAEVTKLVESGGRQTAADLEKYRRVAYEAANSPMVSSATTKMGLLLDGKIPDAAETEKIRESYAKLNEAVKAGKVEVAARISRELHLPIRYEEIQLHLEEENDSGSSTRISNDKWKTLIALGVVHVKATKTSAGGGNSTFSMSPPVLKKERLQELNALNGAGSFGQLVDDMAAIGVSPLNGVPAQDQIQSYMEKVRAKAEKDHKDKPNKQELISNDMLNASQRLMDGMQVHYRGASDKNVEYGPTQTSLIYLYEKRQLKKGPDGKPITLELPAIPKDDPQKAKKEADQKKTIQDWIKANGGDDHFITKPHAPEGWGDMTSQGVYGNRYESDCEGMASFRLRTLPPGFKPLGVVTGFPTGDRSDGHLVAVFRSSDGRVFLSSNGKPPIEVKASSKPAAAAEIRTAVVEEFSAVYGGGKTESSFTFGLAKSTSVAGASLNAVNEATDRVLKEATADEYMRTELKKNPKLLKTPPPLDWSLLAPK